MAKHAQSVNLRGVSHRGPSIVYARESYARIYAQFESSQSTDPAFERAGDQLSLEKKKRAPSGREFPSFSNTRRDLAAERNSRRESNGASTSEQQQQQLREREEERERERTIEKM